MHAPPSSRTAPRPPVKKSRKAFWLKQLHMWHWMSSAISLIGLLLFAVTGFTLNHAADIEAAPVVAQKTAQMPQTVLGQLGVDPAGGKGVLPRPVAAWVENHFPVKATGEAEWSADEVYLPAPRPGGDAWVAIDRASGAVSSEITDRGWISYLNDLHKGRNSGGEWSLFIDVFAFACLIFAITGLVLLWLHSAKRKSTWPLVGAGLILPAAIAIVFIH
ncbi:MAG TPA: PepSY-associated TM helix domain-containing protein [Sphingopyxis sp.]|uniref:PepSY-associated TM helix domain-containing protein n=1 Tax=Sphingopyxis sp. TaxID=1908224 RepID=UPI002E32DA07|nr:PepSY-associated TM helix domain-containing protein [Sphingopyxis sp.]HEX2813384.1 PepSY-associated TM helix domain-containing protein [Sphingopyxis sp.]